MLLAQVNIQEKFAPAKAKIDSISALLKIILPLVSAGAALIFLVMSLYGAFMYLTNGDKPDVLKKAQATIVFAVIGLFVVIFSFVAVSLLGKIFNIPNLL